jgi:DNA-binding CsgD family transcriptional regulator
VNSDYPGSSNGRTNGSVLVSRDHVIELLSTFKELRDAGRSLRAQLRAAMHEMQAQRVRLRQNRAARGDGAAAKAPVLAAVYLQHEYGMTPREVEVAMLLAEGCSNSTVSSRLGISPHTARHHTQRVLGKLGVHSRAEAGARLRR